MGQAGTGEEKPVLESLTLEEGDKVNGRLKARRQEDVEEWGGVFCKSLGKMDRGAAGGEAQ